MGGSLDAACLAFGLDPLETTPLAAGGGLLFETLNGNDPCLLKRYRLLRPENAPILDRLLAACSENSLVPRHFPDSDGSLVVRADCHLYSLMRREDIRPLNPDEDLPAVARILADFHGAALGVPCETELEPPLKVEPGRLRELADAAHPELVPLLDAYDDARPHLPIQLVHNDMHPGNVITTASGTVLLLDLESFSHNPRVGDVLFAAMRLGRQDPTHFRRFVEAYEDAQPLDPVERELGPAVLLGDMARKVGFILHRADKGDPFFLKDLDNYLGFIRWSREFLDTAW